MAPSRKKAGKGSAAAAAAVRLVWNVGDLVLAKVKGFPAWPARVSKPEDWGRTIDHRKIFVFFFGTKQIGYCNPGDLTPFTPETKKVLLAKSQVKNATTDFCRAVKEICGADESSRLGNVNEEISHSASEEGAERESDDLRYFEKEKDLKLDDAERKEEDHTMLVFTRHEKEGRLQQSFESGTEEIKLDGCNVEVDNGVVKMEPNIESGGVGLEKHKGKADARVDSEQSKKKRRFGREDHENPGKSTRSASPKSAELPSSKRSSSRLVRSSSEVGEQKEATCRVDGVSLSVKKKRGESRKIFRSPQSQNPEDVDVRAQPTLNHQVTSPSARILDEANYQTRDLQSNKKGRRLVKDHRGFSTAAHPARGMEVQREYLKVESGNDYKHSKSEQEVTLEVSINRQVSEPSDGFEDRVAFKKVRMNFAAHEESGAATPLESDDDASKREIGEAIQHTSLPKKKRRAIRKSERDFNSFSLVEIAKDAVNSANKEVADAVFQEQQAEDTQGKGAAVEYQRRKRGQVSLHTQGHEPPQIVENNKHDRIKHERSIPGSKGNGKVSPKSSTTCNETESIANRQAYHLKRQKTANSEQNLKVAEDRDEQRSPTRVCLETSSVEDTKCRMSTDEHLPLVKRARARFEKEAQVWLHRELDATVLSSEGKHTDQAPENQSRTASVRVEGTLGLLSVFNGSDARDSSRIIVKRDMSLPPKADKYRIRSSLADGEAALPPLKRRQRALEAMTACAAEAATVVEGGTSVSIEGQWQEAPGGSELKMSFAGRGGHEGSNADKMETRVFGAETLHLKDAVPGEANNKSDDCGAETKECGTVADIITSVQPIEKTGEKLVSGLPGDLNLESTEIKLFSENMDTVKLSVKHTDGHICSPKKWEGTKSSLRPGISQQAKVQGSVDLNKGQMEKPVDVKVKGKSKKHGLTLLKETASLPGVSLNHGATVTLIPNEKLGHESTGTYHEHLVKHAVPIQSEVGGTKTVIESINEQGKAWDKSNGASTGPRVDSLSSVKLQLDVNANKVREAVEAAKGVKQKISKDGEVSTASMSMKYLIAAAQAKRQVRSAVATSTVTYAEMEKVSTALISSPSPGGSSQLNSPAQTLNMGLYQDFQRTTSGGIRTPDAVPETSQSLGQEYREEGNTGPFKTLSREDVITVDTEAFIARDTFEGMLETLSRTRESIARATRHALDCAKYGIAEQVVEILVQRLENEPSFHRRVDLFFLVDSITQCSHNLKGPAGAAYPPAVQTALPRLLSAAAPPGNVARENRRQCLKVLKLWLERSIMPESALRSYMIDLESYSHEKTSGMFPRRPSRSERAVDDPIREMEGMYVDEYGSNATFSLPGLLIPRMYEDDEDACDDDKKTGMCISTFPEEREEAATVSPRQIEKHRHILEDVDGELEMEDVSPTSELEESSGKDQFDGALISQDAVFSAGGVGGVASEGEEQSPPLPSEPPPPPPDCPPPSPPPLPASPPPLSPPPPPPPSPPSHFSTSHLLPPLHSYASSSHLGLQAAQFSPLVLQSGMDGNYLISTEQQPVPPTLGTQHISVLTSEEKRFENYYQPQGNLPGIMQQPPQGSAQTLGIEATFSSPSGFMITQTTPRQYAMVSSGGLPPSLNTSHIQALQLGNTFSQTLYRPLQPVQPSNPFSYGSREAVRQSASSPSLEKELASPQVQNVQGEQSCMLQSDSGRRMFEEIQSSRVDGGQILARGHFHGENGDSTQQSIYSTSDLISGLNCGVIRPMPGAQYASNMPSMQIQVRPQAVTGASLGPISNVDMPHPPYTGHAGAVPGGLVMGVGANQTKLSMLACRPGGSAPNSWRPN